MVHKIVRYSVLLFILVPLLTWFASRGADMVALARWNTEDSAIVILEKVLGREDDVESGAEGNWETERVHIRITYRNGAFAGTTEEIEILQLADSRLELVPGREYLFLVDTF
ncbi:MAG: hypothetical protein PHV21_06195, partial [Synergistaceae bacterium]|nr:hypothetical protein [Synergistaceae bacterium]